MPQQAENATLDTVRDVAALRARVAGWRAAGEKVGLVPTMGALHAGHLALVEAARRDCRRVVVTLFVNPKQFNQNEDFDRYPRDEAADAALLAGAGTDLLYAPGLEVMYPRDFATTVSVATLTARLEGVYRPGHFDGVATVVAKLLLQAGADRAYFGEKDYQQLQVIRRLVADLDIPVAVVGVPTVREEDGLALSSRNRFLSAPERAIAAALPRALQEASARLRESPATSASEITEHAAEALRAAGFASVDYVELCDAETLAPLDRLSRPGRLLAAATVGRTRLIDNILVDPAA